MDEYESLSHAKWECKYYVVFVPKCRRKTLYEKLRRNLGEVFHQLAKQKESRIEEGHLRSDHVHMMIAIPPKYAVSRSSCARDRSSSALSRSGSPSTRPTSEMPLQDGRPQMSNFYCHPGGAGGSPILV